MKNGLSGAQRLSLRTRNPGLLGSFAVLVCFLFLPAGWAQSSTRGQKEVPTFELSVAVLGDVEVPPLFYAMPKETERGREEVEYLEIPVARESIGGGVRIPVARNPQLFVRTSPEGAERPTYRPYLEVPPQKKDATVLLLFYQDVNGQSFHKFFETSGAKHPAGFVRVVNLSGKRIAFSVGGSPQPVGVNGDVVAQPVFREDGRFPFIHYEERGAGQPPYEAPTKLLRFRSPDQRLTVFFTALPSMEDTGQVDSQGQPKLAKVYRPEALRVYDRVPGGVGKAGGAGVAAAAGTPSAPAGSGFPESTGGAAGSAVVPPPNAEVVRSVQAQVRPVGAWWSKADSLELVSTDGSGAPATIAGEGTSNLSLLAGPTRGVRLMRSGIELASAILPEGSNNVLLALAAPADSEGGCAMLAFDNSPQSHPPGTRRIFNLTPYQVAYSAGAGQQATYVNPREAALLREAAGGAATKVAVQTPAGWALVGEIAPAKPGVTESIFVYPEGESGKFAVMEVRM